MTRVLVNVGDTIAREQPVLELETDKATIEVPSSVAGVVKEIRVKKGDKVKVGAVVLTVDAPAGEAAGACGEGCGTGGRAGRGARAAPQPPPAAARSGSERQRRLARAQRRADAVSGQRPKLLRRSRAAPAQSAGRAWTGGAGVAGGATSGARDRRRHQRRPGHRARAAASRRKTSRSTRGGS